MSFKVIFQTLTFTIIKTETGFPCIAPNNSQKKPRILANRRHDIPSVFLGRRCFILQNDEILR